MKKVLIIYRFLPHYRIEFYNRLKEELLKRNVDLQLVYGKSNKTDNLKGDEADLYWAKYVPNRYFKIGRFELIWQPCLNYIRGKDMIIVEGANRLILNYFLMLLRHFMRFKLGVWGHGRNMQINNYDIRNKFKTYFLNSCDCYFAYTESVRRYLIQNRMNDSKIVVVQNAIETKQIKEKYDTLKENDIADFAKQYNINRTNTAIYCGGMYPEKRLDFLLKACIEIRKRVDDFEIVFIGAGVDSGLIQDASYKYDWIHYVGPRFGTEKLKFFKLAKIQLMPGLVGLAILDSFALETPMITTTYEFHSPEIEYLRNNINGIISDNDIESYTKEVIKVLEQKSYEKLINGCAESSKIYTIETMVNNFMNGILKHIV